MKVILTSAGYYRIGAHWLNHHFNPEKRLGLKTIEDSLRQAGFNNVLHFPGDPAVGLDLWRDRAVIIEELKRTVAGENDAVFGLSTTSEEYFKFTALAELIRQEFPQARIVAGGPHFKREKLEGYRDSVETALVSKLADSVVVGHAQPFIDLVINQHGQKDLIASPGLYYLGSAGEEVKGHGYGKFPQLRTVPYTYTEGSRLIGTIFDDSCENRCGFCAIPLSRSPLFAAGTVIDSLRPVFANLAPGQLSLYDSNPFETRRFDYYREVFEGLYDRERPVFKITFLDPSLIVSDDYRNKLGPFLLRHAFFKFFIGRDVVTEQSARVAGSNLRGKVKSQKQLDDEKEALAKFIRALKTVHTRAPDIPPHKLFLSYIITPFEDRESARAIADDMETFLGLSEEGVKVSVRIFPLMPYPGTRVRRELVKWIEPEDYSFSSYGLAPGDPWKEEIGLSHELMSSLSGSYGKSWENQSFLPFFRSIIDKVFAG